MQPKSKFIKTALFTLTGSLIAASVYATFPPSQMLTQPDEEKPQVVIQSNNYAVGYKHCEVTCFAQVNADATTSIYVEYTLDDASIESMDIINVVRDDSTLNAYVDRDEIVKINAAIVGGGK